MLTVIFTCLKDPAVAEHHHKRFGKLFTEQANDELITDPVTLRKDWVDRMTLEAKHQEHWDFTIDDNDRRHLVFDEDGIPVPLIPIVTVGLN